VLFILCVIRRGSNVFPGRMALAPPSAFERLARLLDGVSPKSFPTGNGPVAMTVGEPQEDPPEFITDIINANARDFGRYPPIAGTPAFRKSAASWLCRRFNLPQSAIDPDKQVIPLNGSREGLFLALPALMPESKNGGPPVVLLPNPFYVTYPSATFAAGAEPYYVDARAETGFLPDFSTVPDHVLRRTVAAFFCSPSNPEGACADRDAWQKLFQLADRYDFTVLADECYCEIYDATPPVGALDVRYHSSGGFERLLSFHSLSKRSNSPGLRSGFVAGSPSLMLALTRFRNTCAPQVPIPVLAASAAAWDNDQHVDENRSKYRERFEIARRILGNHRGFRLPDGGFYLWLDVGDGPSFAKSLWRETGVRVLPGAFMSVEKVSGDPGSNPGQRYVRLALVHDPATVTAALERVAEFLQGVWQQ
jgi:N-succinyldiaminopimelate aminotransferase